jgi:hypothetical protein
MKKLLLILVIAVSITSCTTSYYSGSAYQAKSINRFSKKKHIRPTEGPRYIRPGRRGDINHPAVSKQTRKTLKRFVRRSRTQVSN